MESLHRILSGLRNYSYYPDDDGTVCSDAFDASTAKQLFGNKI